MSPATVSVFVGLAVPIPTIGNLVAPTILDVTIKALRLPEFTNKLPVKLCLSEVSSQV